MIITLSIALAVVWWLGWRAICNAARKVNHPQAKDWCIRLLALPLWPFVMLYLVVFG